MSNLTPTPNQVLFVTGATGYVGGRLVPLLLEEGYLVKCLVREPKKISQRSWRSHQNIEVIQGDLKDIEQLTQQMAGCDVGYYLIHSMIAAGGEYAKRDQELAERFAQAAKSAGLKRIIYLGGLGELGDGLSEHLRSRREVEQKLASTGIPVTTFRAAMIIGSGSASFEILRYLVDRLPVMITPRWVETECQPVAIIDVLYWLVEALKTPQSIGRTLEIGGPDAYSYRNLMQIMAEELGHKRRWILTVPLLTPRLSSAWISLVTPVNFLIARPLAEGLKNRVVVGDKNVQDVMPHNALSVRQAIRRAQTTVNENRSPTRWSAAGVMPGDPDWAGGKVYIDQRSILINASAQQVYKAVCRVGGGHGWYAGDLLWRLRGLMDQIVGGPGLRRGRRHPEEVEYGEALDFWRVVGIEKNRHLLLHAEMKLPGTARLEFEIEPSDQPGMSKLIMTARFRPKGLPGLAYWYAVMPFHAIVFGGMLKGIKRYAEQEFHQDNSALTTA